MGKGTPGQWKYYVNMQERKKWEKERLETCVREMEEERARWSQGEEKRKEEEIIAQQLREEEVAGREEEDDPNDLLPFKRAATKDQKKLMEKVEAESSDTIRSAAFQAKVKPTTTTFPPLTPPTAAMISPPVLASSSVSELPALSPVAVRVRGVRKGVGRGEGVKGGGPALQLNRMQRMKAAVVKAIPLHQSVEEKEEQQAALATEAGQNRSRGKGKGGKKAVTGAQRSTEQDTVSVVEPGAQKRKQQLKLAKTIVDTLN